ncbi:MAG TPA: hypothetical protein VE597_07245 [Geminicoccaceae bacterium]|nr:hypothetical protein [Geminicoccaceae bacterium]
MNAARLARKWSDAKGDPALMAEALAEEIDDPATGLVTRDFLRSELAQLETRLVGIETQLEARLAGIETQLGTRIAELETRLLWRLITVFGIQIALVGVLAAALVQVLR